MLAAYQGCWWSLRSGRSAGQSCLPVLNAAKIRAQTANCINNQKELTTGWLMYTNDNHDGCAGNNWPNEKGYRANPAFQNQKLDIRVDGR